VSDDVCTKIGEKRCKPLSIAPNSEKKVQTAEYCTKIEEKRCKNRKYAPKLRRNGAKAKNMLKRENECIIKGIFTNL